MRVLIGWRIAERDLGDFPQCIPGSGRSDERLRDEQSRRQHRVLVHQARKPHDVFLPSYQVVHM